MSTFSETRTIVPERQLKHEWQICIGKTRLNKRSPLSSASKFLKPDPEKLKLSNVKLKYIQPTPRVHSIMVGSHVQEYCRRLVLFKTDSIAYDDLSNLSWFF